MLPINQSSLPAAIQASFNGKVLAFEQPDLIYGMFAQKDVKPIHTGEYHRYEKIPKLIKATVPLGASGVTPPGQSLSSIFLDAKIDYYGTWLSTTRQVTLTNDCPVLNEFVKRLGVNLRETEDDLICSVLATTASSINCVGGVSADNPTELTASDLDNVVRALKMNSAKMMSAEIKASNRFSTAGVREAYWMLSSADLIGNFERVNGWQPKTSYSYSEDALPAEWGSYGNIRTLITGIRNVGNIIPNSSANGFDVYNNFILGKEAYSHIKQEAAGAQFIYRDPMIAGGALAQYSTMGWTSSFSGKVLNDPWCAKLRCTRLN